jgi:hypothetical protein
MDATDQFSVIVAITAVAASFLTKRLSQQLKLPVIPFFLGIGMIAHLVHPPAGKLPVAKTIVDFALGLVGLQIGSHFNREAIWPHRFSILRFMATFVPVVFLSILFVCWMLFPQLLWFAPLVSSIALERSSPEAMANIHDSNASGPFTVTTMCVAALQDIVALFLFVLTSGLLGGGGFHTLLWRAIATAVAMLIGMGGSKLILRLTESRNVAVVWILIVFSVAERRFHAELLLAAILTGTLLNWLEPHPTSIVVNDCVPTMNVILFTLLGMRVNPLAYIVGWEGFAMYFGRLGALWAGGFLGAKVGGLSHPHVRWMGLVTQLAIALTLVQRMEEQFPTAAPLAHAQGGSILLAVWSGPALLHFALRRVGEAGMGGKESIVVMPTIVSIV